MTRLSLVLCSLGLLLAMLWMFLLGLFVGKGISPASINFAEIKKRLVAEGVWPGSGRSSEPARVQEKIPLKDLEFYEALARKKKAQLQTHSGPLQQARNGPSGRGAPGIGSLHRGGPQPQSPAAFTVQVASFRDLLSARKFAARLQEFKSRLTIVRVDLPGKGRWYRVQIGRFPRREDALALARRLVNHYRMQPLVMPLKS